MSFLGQDLHTLVRGLKAGNAAAAGAFYDQFAPTVHRLLHRVVGADPDLADLTHEVFVEALTAIDGLRDPQALPAWLRAITLQVARVRLQRRRRRWWLSFLPSDEMPEPEPSVPDDTARETLRACQAALGHLEPRRRIALVVRYIEGLSLEEGAEAMTVSLATFKRVLKAAEADFQALVPRFPALQAWLDEEAS